MTKQIDLAVDLARKTLDDNYGISTDALETMVELFYTMLGTTRTQPLPPRLQDVLDQITIEDDRAFIVDYQGEVLRG